MLPFFLPLAPNPATALLDSAAAAHASLSRFRVHVELNGSTSQGKVATTFDLAEDGQTFLLRVREPRRPGLDRSDRTFLFTPTRLVAYDAVADEQLTQDMPKGASRVTRMESALGTGADIIRALLDPAVMKQFLGGVRGGNWNVSKHGAETWLTRPVPRSKRRELIALDTSKHLLRRVDAFGQGNAVHWTLTYSPGTKVTFAPPRSARRVNAFTVAPEPPVFLSKQAEEVTRRMWTAYNGFPVGTIDIDGNDGKVKVALNGRKIREESANVLYAYDGETLSILDRKNHRYYRGKAARNTIPDMISEIGASCDNLSRMLLLRRAPYREAFTSSSRVSLGGKVEAASGTCDILSLDNGAARVTFFVRRSDGLIDSLMTTIGGAMSSNRRYRYSHPASPSFSIPPISGESILPLPKVKFLPGQQLPAQRV